MTENYERVLTRALNMLAYAPNTERSLVRKLREKGAQDEDIAAVLDYLNKKGYINERDYLYRFVATQGKTYGRTRIYAAAREKGFAQKILDEYFDDACAQVDFTATCRAQMKKKNKGDPRKLAAALMRAGFDYSTIKAAAEEQDD